MKFSSLRALSVLALVIPMASTTSFPPTARGNTRYKRKNLEEPTSPRPVCTSVLHPPSLSKSATTHHPSQLNPLISSSALQLSWPRSPFGEQWSRQPSRLHLHARLVRSRARRLHVCLPRTGARLRIAVRFG